MDASPICGTLVTDQQDDGAAMVAPKVDRLLLARIDPEKDVVRTVEALHGEFFASLDPNVFEHHSSYGVMLQERSVQDRAKYHYWMAALYAQEGRSDLALQYLRKALEEGYKERKKLPEDPAFASMRDLPEFKELIALEPRVL
jgi:hypothetical protein